MIEHLHMIIEVGFIQNDLCIQNESASSLDAVLGRLYSPSSTVRHMQGMELFECVANLVSRNSFQSE